MAAVVTAADHRVHSTFSTFGGDGGGGVTTGRPRPADEFPYDLGLPHVVALQGGVDDGADEVHVVAAGVQREDEVTGAVEARGVQHAAVGVHFQQVDLPGRVHTEVAPEVMRRNGICGNMI
ncbi:hypothetical protein Vafri_10353 [Volvox africanus]|uniref:Uncharacterized protein n=1 Tax=Volvox africanus TaxID=51714 RepID=A0A8J4EZJ4_9CHLO|nr:hypothetical protein Vafri_10353 [Volvox africanus]